jgi:hypothetical protein
MAVVLAAGSVRPAEAEEGPLVVRDVSVLLLSASGTKLNERSLFDSTLPGFMLTRRQSAARSALAEATPSGIMTFSGSPAEDVDVLLEFSSGRMLTHWPPGRLRSTRLLWAGLNLTGVLDTAPSRLADGHWLSGLREADRLHVTLPKQSERFLLYDVELAFAPHLRLERIERGYRVHNTANFAARDVHVFRPLGDGRWDISVVDQVDGVEKTETPADTTASATDGKTPDESVFAATPGQTPADTSVAPAQAAEAKPADPTAGGASPLNAAEQPQPAPAETSVRPSVTADALSRGPLAISDALAEWDRRLAAWKLDGSERDHVLKILKAHAFRDESAMLVYRLEDTELERLLPLEVTPYPERVYRVAIVIMQDADPDLQTRIEALIAQLGDEDWHRREQAHRELHGLGLAAKPKLEQAITNTDVEIVYRAEQLLEEMVAKP